MNINRQYHFVAFCLFIFTSLLSTTVSSGVEDNPPVNFGRQILPILSNKCFVCHGPDAQDEDGLRLDSFEGATADRGGYRAVDPERPQKSRLLERIHSPDDPMPPADAEKQLTDEERRLLTLWVKSGGKYAKHWAFVPPSKNAIDGSLTEVIDQQVGAKLQEKQLDFAPQADRATLARRVALVLTGLPPEPEQLQRFLDDSRENAYERFVDEMLASPRFGEHQARYWLDAVRYGDTHGLHLDNRRGIYPYRDWVVRAFNQNLPLDTFIRWQLAGDLLPSPTTEQLIATGFVRMNPTTAEGGVIPAEFQAKNNFDRTETLGTVFLGLTLTCARCHTHKYDPISQSEYYQLLAFFNSTEEKPLDGNSYTYAPVLKVPADQTAWEQWQELLQARQQLIDRCAKVVANAELTNEQQALWQSGDADRQLTLLAEADDRLKSVLQDLSQGTDISASAAELLEKMKAAQEAFTTTLIAKELATPRETHVLRRGEYDMPQGDPVAPNVPAIISGMPEGVPKNRLGLAAWLTSRDNTLVARVLVNRIWQRVFGLALVRTPEDFGVQGEQPTHPELLDWLAVELHDSQWNHKHLLKSMVMSRTFRQSSAWRKGVNDPENRLWARGPRHRLDAETLRDLGLWASGLLDPTMGGEGVKPYQPSGMWLAMAHPASNTKQYVQDKGAKLYRRSLYVYWKRTSPHPMMTLFDAPSRESSCVRRSRTNTPSQALAMLNEPQRVEMNRMLAERLLREEPNDAARLNLLFRLLASRTPDARERDICLSLLAKMRDRYQAAPNDALQLLAIGEAKRDESLPAADVAAWSQVTAAVLASDLAIMLY